MRLKGNGKRQKMGIVSPFGEQEQDMSETKWVTLKLNNYLALSLWMKGNFFC